MIWIVVSIVVMIIALICSILRSVRLYRRNRPFASRNVAIIAAFLIILLLVLLSSLWPFPLSKINYGKQIINVPQSSLDIVLDAPTVMQKDTSYTIKVILEPKGKPLVTSLGIEGASATDSKTIAMGTPGATLGSAFGPGFQAPSGKATLSSGTFDIAPVGSDGQSLDQPEVTWEWSVTPKSPGVQFLALTIEATWTTANGVEWGPYRLGDRTFKINVQDSFVHTGNFDIGAVLTSLPAALVAALFGAGGLGAVLVLWIVRRRPKGPGKDDDILFADD